jgi:hypothetical protein
LLINPSAASTQEDAPLHRKETAMDLHRDLLARFDPDVYAAIAGEERQRLERWRLGRMTAGRASGAREL